MDIQSELNELEKLGFYVLTSHEGYKTGFNLMFAILRVDTEDRRKRLHQTGSYGDNHEFGSMGDTMVAAIKLAKYLVKNPKAFETPTELDPTNLHREKLEYFTRTLYTRRHREFIDTLLD